MKSNEQLGILINFSGKNRYMDKESVDRGIRYILRERECESRKDELIAGGAIGAPEWQTIEKIVESFHYVQQCHRRKGRFGRYIDHQVFSLSDRSENKLCGNRKKLLEQVARNMAKDIYEDGRYQVVYGIHRGDHNDSHTHIHFIVNTVDASTGRKRHENKKDNMERQKRFQEILAVAFNEK